METGGIDEKLCADCLYYLGIHPVKRSMSRCRKAVFKLGFKFMERVPENCVRRVEHQAVEVARKLMEV